MSTTNRVLHLDAYRGRRRSRVQRTLALLAPDPPRRRLGEALAELLQVVGGDRAAAIWSDEFGQLVPRPHVILDLQSESPRREFDSRIFSRAWSLGIPGLVDLPELPRGAIADLPRSSACIALGSDGIRSWFLAVDSVAARGPLDDDARAMLLHVAGECAALLLHRDLMETGVEVGGERFTGWSILTDLDEREDGDVDSPKRTRVTERFLVLRLVRSLLDDELIPDPEYLADRVRDLRGEITPDGLWTAVLDAAEAGDDAALSQAVIAVGRDAEDRGELEGAIESFRAAYWVAAFAAQDHTAVEAARFLGRSLRRAGRWDESERWYVASAGVAEACGDPRGAAVALDGQGATLRARGNVPGARRVLARALELAEESGDPYALGSVNTHLMTLHHLAGEGEQAVRHGWASVSSFRSEQDRLNALVSLAGILLDLGAADLAEEAYELTLGRLTNAYFRAFALEGFAHAAALQGDRAVYEERYEPVLTEALATGGVEFRCQAYLYRGRAFEALADLEEAREWYRKASDFARECGLHANQSQADEALSRLEDGAGAHGPAPLTLPDRTVAEVRGGLGALRRELASVAS